MAVPAFQPVRPATLRLAFAPDLASARAVALAIRAFLKDQGVPEPELFAYELCLAEAANNAVEYATGPQRSQRPVAEAVITAEEVELRMTDHTAGFVLPEAGARPSPRQDRGRGLFLIRTMMDDVRYFRGAAENVLVMRKRRAPRPAPAAGPAPHGMGSGLRAFPATEPSFRSETFSAIFRRCAEMGHSTELAAGFGDRLLLDLLQLSSADWCVLRVLSADNRQLEVAAVSEPGLVTAPVVLPGKKGTPPGIEAAAALRRAVTRFDLPAGTAAGEPLRAVGPEASGLVCPLCVGETLVGTLAIGCYRGEFPKGKLQEEVIRAFAEFLAIQTVNFRHYQQEVRNRVLARELEIAREIQHLLLPRTLPQLAGFGLAGGWQSAREVGGDFYDAIPLGERSLLLMIADVMGKGVPAALFSTTMRGLLRGLAARSNDPAQLLSGLNRLLHAELSTVDMFITAQIVHLDLDSRQVTAASAGQCPLLFRPRGSRNVTSLPTRGLPLGVLPGTAYRNVSAVLGEPAVLLLHTDGLTDARNPAGRRYGERRLTAWLQANSQDADHHAGDLRDRLASELARYRGDAVMADDQAFLVLSEEECAAPRAAEAEGLQPETAFLLPAVAAPLSA
ncbi:MAG TPA: SpoIIE family protein phosphatase [Opitutaceae bacterium]|nr:SpoIIE family protein phosphatase [Opitutaceae bacterium]